jgi:hypothetical protein
MKRLFAALALLLAAGGAEPCLAQGGTNVAATALDPERLAVAREVVDLAFPQDRRHALLASVGDNMMMQVRDAVLAGHEVDPGAEQILQRYLERVRAATDRTITEGSPAIFAAVVRAYARMFTHDELVQIRAFVSTPAGAKYIQRSPDLLADPDVAQANTAYMRSAFATLQPLQAEFRREMEDYIAHHPR